MPVVTATGLTKERMLTIEAQCIVDGAVDLSGYLKLTTHGGDVIDAGHVRGTRWGTTHTWVFGDPSPNVEVFYADGLPPQIGDLILGDNGFDVGQVSSVVGVVDNTHADLQSFTSLRGPQGTAATALTAWPIGSIFMNVTSTDPAVLLGGGTWERYAKGRVLVGLDEAQTEFDSPEEIGGEKAHVLTTPEMPAHIHQLPGNSLDLTATGSASGGTVENGGTSVAQGATGGRFAHPTNHPTVNLTSTGGGGAHNNLQPYVTVYMWKRTA